MKVLIIEDDREIVEILSLVFEMHWPGVEMVSTHLGEIGVGLVESESPDVLILDLGLPDISGYDVLKRVRDFSNIPIIILTVRGEEADVIKGLIKTNTPGRIGLSVSSRIDSKIILDIPGAENLTGNGDLICVCPALRDGIRLQGAYITNKEIFSPSSLT